MSCRAFETIGKLHFVHGHYFYFVFDNGIVYTARDFNN